MECADDNRSILEVTVANKEPKSKNFKMIVIKWKKTHSKSDWVEKKSFHYLQKTRKVKNKQYKPSMTANLVDTTMLLSIKMNESFC